MKRIIAIAAMLVLILFVLPILFLDGPQEETGESALLSPPPIPIRPEIDSGLTDAQTTVRVLLEDGTISEMSMADYLWSVTAAEMPASFELEALKAQAVTARTYTARKMAYDDTNHPDADVCTDITCCQAFLSWDEAVSAWGDQAEEYAAKINTALSETDGQLITYQGEPIQALFFSSSTGRTEDAVEVWGNSVPYLVGVDSPEGEDVPNYTTEVTLTAQQFRDIFLAEYPDANLSGTPDTWFDTPILSASGRVSSMGIGGISVKGTLIRTLFSLRSTCFTVVTEGDSITFQVTGYGHGVGMSQYGAQSMAMQGKTYQEILTWYYTGVEITS